MTLEEKNLILAYHMFEAAGDQVNLQKTIDTIREKYPKYSWIIEAFKPRHRTPQERCSGVSRTDKRGAGK